MQETKPELLTGEVFERISKQWMLITAGPEKNCNTMTASWGGLGILWGKPVSTIYIRPQRYTREFVEREDYYTLSFLPEQYLHHAVELFTYQVNRCAYIFSGCILQQVFCYSFILLRIMQIGI